MPPVGFEPTISAGERPQIYAFRPRGHWDRLVTIITSTKDSWDVAEGEYGAKREEVSGDCRKLQNEEIHDLYFSTYNSGWSNHERRDERGVQHAWRGVKYSTYTVSVIRRGVYMR